MKLERGDAFGWGTFCWIVFPRCFLQDDEILSRRWLVVVLSHAKDPYLVSCASRGPSLGYTCCSLLVCSLRHTRLLCLCAAVIFLLSAERERVYERHCQGALRRFWPGLLYYIHMYRKVHSLAGVVLVDCRCNHPFVAASKLNAPSRMKDMDWLVFHSRVCQLVLGWPCLI